MDRDDKILWGLLWGWKCEAAAPLIIQFIFAEHLWVLIPDILIVMGAELLVDWVKHAFITKFNGIPVDVNMLFYFMYW